MGKGLFITGTGTDVGKTFVTGLIVKKLREAGFDAAYFKAAMSGNDYGKDGTLIPGDAAYVKEASGIRQPLEEMCPYVYECAYSPHLAAKLEGNPVSLEVVKERFGEVMKKYGYVTMEGSGGILCPLCFEEERLLLEDVILALKLPCLLVADAGLGTLNSLALTVFYMRAKGIPVKGILLNRFHPGNVLEEDNSRMCESLTGIKVLACIGEGDRTLNIEANRLAELYE